MSTIKMVSNRWLWTTLPLLFVWSCAEESSPTADGGADGDADADTDTDTDADTDSDGDADSDADGDTDTSTGEDWEMHLAVDDQFDVYFGTPIRTTGDRVGQGTDWTQEYFYTAKDRKSTDYLYVATASDLDGAQGFIGTFTNVTLGKTTTTSDDVWDVFAAGAHEATNPFWPDEWPASLLPTQEQVDTAIAYAQANKLWVTPTFDPAFDNDPNTDPTDGTGWTHNPWWYDYPNIPDNALWIWFDSGTIPDGEIPGVFTGGNHDEFLVFRVPGAVAPIE